MKIYIINLQQDVKRKEFQIKQFDRLKISVEFINATTIDDIEILYQDHFFDWQRPLRKVEVACYYSHRRLWEKIAKDTETVLILEDDVLISKDLSKVVQGLHNFDFEYINLESTGRKKLIAKENVAIDKKYNIYEIFQDRNGAGGYILTPSGAKKLLKLEEKIGIGLADAHIRSCLSLNAFQIEPLLVLQDSETNKYGLESIIKTVSNISSKEKPKIPLKYLFYFKSKRIKVQLIQGYVRIKSLFIAQKRVMKILIEDFKF